MPGRKGKQGNHKKEEKTAWKGRAGGTRRSVITKT